MILTIWELFINALEILIFYIYLNSTLRQKKLYGKYRFLPFAMLFITFCIQSSLNFSYISSSITSLILFILDILYAFIFFENAKTPKFFYGALFSIICLIADYLTVTSIQIFSNISIEEIVFKASYIRIPTTGLYIGLLITIVLIIKNIKNDKLYFLPYQRIFFPIINILGIVSVEFLLMITIKAIELDLSDFATLLAIFNTIYIALFMLLLFHIFNLSLSKHRIIELTEKNALLSIEEEQYKNLIETTYTLREIKHDLEHHLNIIQYFLNHKDYENLSDYITQYQKEFKNIYRFPSTGLNLLDCILASTIQKAQINQISVNYHIILPDSFRINKIKFTSLFSNLFANALDACIELKQQKPELENIEIMFSIKPFQNMIAIHIENPCLGNYSFNKDGELKSTKSSNMYIHGIGINRIKQIIAELNGIIDIKPNADRFIVHILLPLNSESEVINENSNSRK